MSEARLLPERLAVVESTIGILQSDTVRIRDGLQRMEAAMGTDGRKLDLLIQLAERMETAIGEGRQETHALELRLTALEHTVGQWRAIAGAALTLAGLGAGREAFRAFGWAP
jgi:hypothetical protein